MTDSQSTQCHSQMDSKREKLEAELRLSIKQAEDGSTFSTSIPRCKKTLKAVHVFLTHWDVLERDETNTQFEDNKVGVKHAEVLPHRYLRGIFCRVLSNLNPVENVDIVREILLSTLRSLKTASCRQLVFDFLPAVSRSFAGRTSHTDLWRREKSERVKGQVLSCLKEVFENEPNSLSQILQYFSTILAEACSENDLILPRDVFHFMIEILPEVPEEDLHIAFRALIHHVDTVEDARLGVDSVRTELALLETTEISGTFPVATILYETVRGTSKNEKVFVEEYFLVMEQLLSKRKTKQFRTRSNGIHNDREVEMKLLTVDLIIVITLISSSLYRDKILRMISDDTLFESGLLTNAHMSRLVDLINGNHICTNTNAYNLDNLDLTYRHRLWELLIEFLGTILLCPMQCLLEVETENFYSKVQDLLVHVIHKLPQYFQTKAVSMILKIFDKLTTESEDTDFKSESKDCRRNMGETKSRICVSIFGLLNSLVSKENEILTPFQSHLVDYITSESFNHLQNLELLQLLCTVVAKVTCNTHSNGHLDSIEICRNLLFSAPRINSVRTIPDVREKLKCRQIRGMIFANAIISCSNSNVNLLVTTQKMVSRILLSSNTNTLVQDPRIHLHGMKNIRHLWKQMKYDRSIGNELFQVVSHIMSHLRLVHYPDESFSQASEKTYSISAYDNVKSSCLLNDHILKRRKFRKMVFRFHAFCVNEIVLNQVSVWESFIMWIFELIDTYLVLGRTTKWTPHAWVFAGVELPTVSAPNLVTVKRTEKVNNWMKFLISESRFSRNSSITSRMEKEIVELIKRIKSISEKEAMIDSISRFALSLLSALSSSIAVLCNTYDHFKDLLTVGCGGIKQKHGRKNEALQMIQYQFTKIYDLKDACVLTERLFRSLGSRSHTNVQMRTKNTKKRRLSRESLVDERTKIQTKAEVVARFLKESLSRLLYSGEFVPQKALWVCLTDSSHDTQITSAMKNLEAFVDDEALSEVVQLRLDIIEHLVLLIPHHALKCYSFQASLGQGSPKHRCGMIRCVSLIPILLLNYPSKMKTNESDKMNKILTKLVVEYLRLVCAILISAIDCEQNTETKKRGFSIMLGVYLSIVGRQHPSTDSNKSRIDSHSFSQEEFDLLISSFMDHINDIHTPITSQILETLSIFAAKSSTSSLQRMVDVHWDATFQSKFASGTKCKNITEFPYVLTNLLKSICFHKQKGYADPTTNESHSYYTIAKLMKYRCMKSTEKHQHLVLSMYRHWGLLALAPHRINLIANFLENLLRKLIEYLSGITDFLGREIVNSKENGELSDYSDEDDGEYIPPTPSLLVYKPSIPILPNFACLTSSSYPIYLDALLRMTVSSIALFSISEEMSSAKESVTTSCDFHPVYKLQRIASVYGSLVKLYKNKFPIFPKSLISSIIKISKCALDVCRTKSQEYVEWRNCQPVPLAEEVDSDLASTLFLKKLLDTFGVHVIGTLRIFCSMHSGSTVIQGDGIVQAGKNSELIFGKVAMPGIISLGRRIERTFKCLSEMSNRYNSGEIQTDYIVQQFPQYELDPSTNGLPFQEEAPSRTEPSKSACGSVDGQGSGNLDKEIENTTEASTIQNMGSRRSLAQTIEKYESPYSEDEESFIDDDEFESSSSGSDGFGVSGNWGQHTGGSDKEYDPEFLIDRFEKSS